MNMETLHCIGCGVAVQAENPKGLGYAPPSALQKDDVICQRCFRLRHYNEVADVELTDQDFLDILHKLGQEDSLIVKVIDIFDFNGSWIPGIQRFVGSNPVMLVGNKVDLLPRSTNKDKLISWMKKQAVELGLKPAHVMLVSAEKGNAIEEALEKIEDMRNGKDVYVVGCTNVGKSTFINRIIKEVSNIGDLITTSHFPGTTLNMIKIELDDGKSLVDTPGIINHHQMAHFVSSKELKVITPKKEIKPRVYQLNEEQTLFFGGLARIDYLGDGRRSLICYLSNAVEIHRTKRENADQLYEKHAGGMLQPPGQDTLDLFPPLVRHDIKLKDDEMDIVFSGLGWITVKEKGARLAAYAPKGVSVLVRPSLI